MASDGHASDASGNGGPTDILVDDPQELLDEVETALAGLRADAGDAEAIEALVRAGVLLLAGRMLAGEAQAPFPESRTPPTTALALTICALMEAGDIDIPQLAMWQALGLGAPTAEGAGTDEARGGETN